MGGQAEGTICEQLGFGYFRPYRRRGALALGSIVAQSVLGLAPAVVFKTLIDYLTKPHPAFGDMAIRENLLYARPNPSQDELEPGRRSDGRSSQRYLCDDYSSVAEAGQRVRQGSPMAPRVAGGSSCGTRRSARSSLGVR